MADETARPPGVTEAVVDLVTTTLETGASVARSLAALTTTRDLPPRGAAPIDDIITFGVTAAGNLVHRAVDAAQTAARFAEKSTPGNGSSAAAPGRPRVTQGSVLRMPLLVENTGANPTTELSFSAAEVVRIAGAAGEGIKPEQVTFAPPTLVIGQRDFEKLTVRIHTAETTAPGTYRAAIVGGDEWFRTTIEIDVVEAVGSTS